MYRNTHKTGCIASQDLVEEDDDEGVEEGKGLLAGSDGTSPAIVECTNGESSGGGSGEGELLGDNVVLPEGNDEENTEESSREC